MKRDNVYAAMAAAHALPAEIAPPDLFLDHAIRRALGHAISAGKRAGQIPASFKCRLIWTAPRQSAKGRALGGTTFTAPGWPPVIALAADCVNAGAAAFVAAFHELAHALGQDDERKATRFAWRTAGPALAVVNAELEAATTGEAAIAWQMIHPGGGGLRRAGVVWAGDRATSHGRRESVVWA